MAFPDSTWACGGHLSSQPEDTGKVSFEWVIRNFLTECQQEGKHLSLRSDNFEFAGVTWNLFISFDQERLYSLFGINIRGYRSSDMFFQCESDISFALFSRSKPFKTLHCNFECRDAKSFGLLVNFFSDAELNTFLNLGCSINCEIKVLKSSINEACPPAEVSHSISSRAVEAHTQTELFENEVCQDLKNLLLSEEGSDVTIQVRDQQFKAHRSILMARSSVFAATFRHDMKENATGLLNVEDCDPSSFPVLLEFLYSGNTEKLSAENVFGLYTSADKYDIQGLKMKCFEFIKSNLSVDTFCETLTLSLLHSETNLLKLAVDFFAKNFKEIILTTKWQAFIVENPIQGNEILIKALASDSQNA